MDAQHHHDGPMLVLRNECCKRLDACAALYVDHQGRQNASIVDVVINTEPPAAPLTSELATDCVHHVRCRVLALENARLNTKLLVSIYKPGNAACVRPKY